MTGRATLLCAALGWTSLYAQEAARIGDLHIARWIETTRDTPWQEKRAGDSTGGRKRLITISAVHPRQEIDGFGGCFNEMGWNALSSLAPDVRDTVLKDIFDPVHGAKFAICRMPVGANDYSMEWYSYDETAGDFEMNEFSIEHDRKFLIPYIKAAQKINPSLNIWASPWCPPSWMKVNDSYACVSSAKYNTLPSDKAGREMHTMFRMEEKYLNAYALYLSKFVTAYAEHGIGIYAVHVQNEPNSAQIFPSCIWEPKDLAIFIGKYLGPRFSRENAATSIWLGTIERPQTERITQILDDPEASKYIRGAGFQWAGKDAISEVHRLYPDLNLMQTETECGDGSNDWKAMEHTFALMKHYFDKGARSYMYWNMVLDETGTSRWGWMQNSMVSIDPVSRTYRYNPEFYLMKHYSYFVGAGYKNLEVRGDYEHITAFIGGNSEIVVVALNPEEDPVDLRTMINGASIVLHLEACSLNTFSIETSK